MRDPESSAVTRSCLTLRGWAVVCILSVMSVGWVSSRGCWDCDLCASSLISVGCVSAHAQEVEREQTWFEGAGSSTGTVARPSRGRRSSSRRGLRLGRPAGREGGSRRRRAGRPVRKTVIPALIDAHQHIGLTNVKDGSHSKDNYTLGNLVEHLERSAYHGVAATMSLGLEFDEALAFELRNTVLPNAARFLTSGRGIAATPMAGPQQSTGSGSRVAHNPRRRGARRSRNWTVTGSTSSRSGSTTGAARCRSWSRRSTGRSSTRRMPGACGACIWARRAGWPTPRT